MRIKVLMVNGESLPGMADAAMLKERGFMVYNCNDAIVDEMVKEIMPNVIFINPNTPGLGSTKVYHELIKDVTYASIPVVYTLLEDDVYLVHGKRTAKKEKKNVIADNIIDGIKASLTYRTTARKRKPLGFYNALSTLYQVHGA